MFPSLFPSSEQLFEVLRESPTGISVVKATEPDSGRFVMVNEAFCDLLGYSEGELLELSIQEVTHSDDLARDLSYWEQLVRGEMHSFGIEKRAITSSGEMRWLRLHVSLVRDAEGAPLYTVGQAVDITELKQLLQSQAALIESAPDAIVSIDAEGRITEFNPAAERAFGYSRAVVLGRPMTELLVPPAHRAGLRRAADNADDSLFGRRMELTAMRVDGLEFPIELTVTRTRLNPPAYTGFVRDLTERRTAAQRLEESERRYQRIAETAAEGIWILDADHRTSFVNPRTAEMLGLRAQDMMGRHPLEFTHDDWKETTREALDRRRDGKRDAYQTKLVHRDGHDVWVWVSASPVHEDDGTYAGVLCMVTDVTEWVLAAREREELQTQLHQSQRLETVGKLAGGVAHDFNNLLSVVLNYAAFLQEELADHPEAAESLAEIRRAAEGGAALTGRLLAFSRRDPGRPETLDLRRVVNDVRRLLERTMGKGVELEIRLPDELPPVTIDLHQLEQVLLNLAVNARDAMPGGGRLTIELREEDGFACLEVRDTGTGMDDEVAERAFEPFFTTKPSGAGTGLGLATVYGIATQAGGHVALDSSPGQGTAVTVKLPADTPAPPPAPEPERPEPPAGAGQTVMLVDDEDAVRAVAVRILEKHGYRVLEAAGGEEALELYRGLDSAPDLVVTDVAMPRMSGLDLARVLAEEHESPAPVVFVSGYSGASVSSAEALEMGSGFIQKPFSADSLLQGVGEALAGARAPV